MSWLTNIKSVIHKKDLGIAPLVSFLHPLANNRNRATDMKVILYIGHHKVGSTALQTFLSQNSYRLLQHGILYPYVERQGALLALAKGLIHSDKIGAGPINMREAHNALAFRMLAEQPGAQPFPPYHRHIPPVGQILQTIQNQVKRHKPETVILCGEAFSNLGPVVPEQIDALRNSFAEAKFEIYLALRRPDEYITAWQSQRLLFGSKIPALSDPKNDYGYHGIHFNFRALLEPWLQRIPNANLVLRPYSEIMRSGGSYADFTKYSSVDFPDGLLAVAPKNSSLPTALMEISRLGNFQLCEPDARALWHGLHRASALIRLPKNNDVEMFGHSNRLRILESFEPVHRYLNTLSGSSCFFPDYAKITHSKPIPLSFATNQALTRLNAGVLAKSTTKEAANFILSLRRKHQSKAA